MRKLVYRLVISGKSVVTLATHHAPKGGIIIAGKKFKGGEFVPDDKVAQATDEQKAKLEKRADLFDAIPEEPKLVEPPILNSVPSSGTAESVANAKNAIPDHIEALAKKYNRTIKPDAKVGSYQRSLGHGKRDAIERRGGLPEVGEVLQTKTGPRLVVGVGRPEFISDDFIEDMDAWHSYPDGPGWYGHYEAVPVERNADEEAGIVKAEAKKTAEKDEAAKKGAAESEKWSLVANYPTVWQLPPGLMAHHREHFHVPPNLADEETFERAINMGRDLDENKRLASSDDYYKKEGAALLDAHSRATPEQRKIFEERAGSAKMVRAADKDKQWAEVQRHYRETGHRIPPLWIPDGARSQYNRLDNQARSELEKRIPDGHIRAQVQKDPKYKEALAHSLYSGDQAKYESHLERAIPAETAKAEEGRAASRKVWGEWYDASKPELEKVAASVLPTELVSEAMRYIKDEIKAGGLRDEFKNPEAWAKDIQNQLKSNDGFPVDAYPAIHAHIQSLKQKEAEAEAERKRKAKEKKAANPDHVVTGNTFPYRDDIKRLGGRWDPKSKTWTIPASAVRRLPRGLSSRPVTLATAQPVARPKCLYRLVFTKR